MMRSLKRMAVALGCVAMLAAPQALAQTSPQGGANSPPQLGGPRAGADSIAGDWLFDTSEFEGDCVIKGRITFRAGATPNSYSCTFVSEQICGPINDNMHITVNQSCVAQKVGRQVAITSAVEKIVEARVNGRPFNSRYLADNFIVSLSRSLLEMTGDHYDEIRELKARFWRDVDLLS